MRSTKLLTLFATAALLSGLACKKPAPAPEAPKQADTTQQDDAAKRAAEEAARREAEERAKREAEEAARKAAAEKLEAERRAAAEKEAAFKAAAEKALQNIHFDYDKSEIMEGDRAMLQGIADFMKANGQVKVEISGHCDERGTNEYNLALGNRRAAAALRYLVSLGVAEDRFTTISFGKEKPLCTESAEGCWSKNRRAEFHLK